MTPFMKLTLAGIALAAVAGCQQPAEKAPAAEAGATAPAGDNAHAFRIGEFQAWALKDGSLTPPNDGKVFAIGEPKADVDALLTAAGAGTETLELSIQPLLVRMGERVVLFDTGAAGGMGTQGLLPGSLAAAGVAPDQVTDVLISHGHGDHVGGLVNAQGGLAFPNATVRMSANEWRALQGDAQMAALVAAITPKVQTFQPDAEVLPGVTAVDIRGHTAGHSGYLIGSGADRVLYIGDTMHHYVISVQRPDWTVAFDGDASIAEPSRKAVLARAADENLRVYAVHFPYPGLGKIQRRGADYVWVPEAAAQP